MTTRSPCFSEIDSKTTDTPSERAAKTTIVASKLHAGGVNGVNTSGTLIRRTQIVESFYRERLGEGVKAGRYNYRGQATAE